MALELGPNGFKRGEWFCRDFADAGRVIPAGLLSRNFGDRPHLATNHDALETLERIRADLLPDVLYEFGAPGSDLKEQPFSALREV